MKFRRNAVLTIYILMICLILDQYRIATIKNYDNEIIGALDREVYTLEDEINALNEKIAGLEEEKDILLGRIAAITDDLHTGIDNAKKFNTGVVYADAEVNLLARLVECEAGGEPIEGKIAVANVVLNRVRSDKYPDNIMSVIYQKNQFQPVTTGKIDRVTPSDETRAAVERALNGEKAVNDDIVIFWATWLDPSHEIWAHCDVVTTIGVHNFANNWE